MRDTSQYILNGTRYPSPSEILSTLGFNAGMMSIPEDILEAAAARGNRVHDWAEAFLLGRRAPIPAAREEELRCSAFVDWFEEEEPEVIDVERLVYSHEIRVAGKLDILTQDTDGKLVITDIKTGNSPKVYTSYPIQQALYSIAVREMNGLDYYPERRILQLPKDGSYRLKTLDNPEDFDIARAAASVMWRLIDEKEVRLS